MQIRLITIGKFKQGVERSLFEHYNQRLNPAIDLIEIPEPKGEKNTRIAREAQLIEAKYNQAWPVIMLDETGGNLSSRELAARLAKFQSAGFNIIIGGADGLDKAMLKRADLALAFGKMTFPHLLVRGLIAEQIYRVKSILNNHPYHKD